MTERQNFATLVPLHARDMLRIAAALIGVSEAEDAAQEALLQAWVAWPSLRDEGATRAWLLRIKVNVCYQWQRGNFGRHRRLTEPLPDESDSTTALLALLEPDPGASGPTGALDLRQAVNQLDPQMRIVVALRYYAGMDASEIGLALGVPAATVRSRLRRALEALRTHLTSIGYPRVVNH